jgi:lysine 2,3-aminomutase
VNYTDSEGEPVRVTYTPRLAQLTTLAEHEKHELEPITKQFAFRSNDYYNSLIDWSNPADPLRVLIVPQRSELADWGELDASSEASYQPVRGLEHKYADTALLLCADTCAAYCRFCFRKRLFQEDNDEVVKDISAGLEYIRQHPQINNVLLTGGDPLILSTQRLTAIFASLQAIEHVRLIRIGTKIPAFNPFRILSDPGLLALLAASRPGIHIYLMIHFNHPRELTREAREAIRLVQRTGTTVVNQTPIIRGVNDSSDVLGALFNELTFCGVQPYYVFGCRPTQGNLPFVVPVETAFKLFDQARSRHSGLAKSARFVLSHRMGKIEVLAVEPKRTLMRYHNAVDPSLNGQYLEFPSKPSALWLDDYLADGKKP